jgi:hypothetical protein
MAAIVKSQQSQQPKFDFDFDAEVLGEEQEQNPRLVYYISRYKSRKGGQLRLGEYGGMSETGYVKSFATYNVKFQFLSGLFAAYENSKGEKFWSRDRAEGAEEVFFGVTINFSDSQVRLLHSQIEELKEKMSKPPKNEQGRSELKGFQLQVELTPKAMGNLTLAMNDGKGRKAGNTFLTEEFSIPPSGVKKVSIVTQEEDNYFRGGAQVSLDDFVQARCKAEHSQAPKGPEATKAFLDKLHAQAKEGKTSKNVKDRRKGRDSKAAAKGGSTFSEEMS